MSRKTENIYKAIGNLESLQKQLEEISHSNNELDDIQFEMNQNLKNLKFWVESLYLYNGKSTSRAKQNSSRENGKLGGRPPKEITLAKRRIKELENELIPQTEHSLKMGDENLSEEQLQNQLEQFQTELNELNLKVSAWISQKNK